MVASRVERHPDPGVCAPVPDGGGHAGRQRVIVVRGETAPTPNLTLPLVVSELSTRTEPEYSGDVNCLHMKLLHSSRFRKTPFCVIKDDKGS